MRVEPSLERVDVLVEVTEPTTVIPRNALIEANQSGLIAEPLIDITPQTPIPDWKVSLLAVFLPAEWSQRPEVLVDTIEITSCCKVCKRG
jgi:hypothetical protein